VAPSKLENKDVLAHYTFCLKKISFLHVPLEKKSFLPQLRAWILSSKAPNIWSKVSYNKL
jgi:hypothetical protein